MRLPRLLSIVAPDFSLIGQVSRLAWPVVTYSLLESLVGLVDVAMVSRLGEEPLSAVGLSRAVLMIVIVVVLAITTGATTMVAQATGAKRLDERDEVTRQALVMMAAAFSRSALLST